MIAIIGSLALFLLIAIGCQDNLSNPATEENADNLRQLAWGYIQFATENHGKGPADRLALQKFLTRKNQRSKQKVDTLFVSPRDKEPYIIRWGLRLWNSGPPGARIPKPKIIMYEKSGTGGTRCVADSRSSVVAMAPKEFSEAVPDP